MSYYRDLREYLRLLDERGQLVRIGFEVNKDTEIHPMVRLQYRGLAERERKAFLFENITDSRGRKYAGSYALCAMAGTREIYALGLRCGVDEIAAKWTSAQLNMLSPTIVTSGSVHEEIHCGHGLLEHGGLDEFPVPISTPGFDCAPYFTSPCWVTKDLDTGIRNVGMYRAQVKAQDRTGVVPSTRLQGLAIHWDIARRKGVPLPAAMVLGAMPNVVHVAASGMPHGVDEYAVAGGLSGEPVSLVKCRTVDLEVPAEAEIVLEGEIPTDTLEPEAPFGESLGLMGLRENMPFFRIKCITHRRHPVLHGILAEFPPNEGTKLLSFAGSSIIYKYLKHDCGMENVLEVAQHEQSSAIMYAVIRLRRGEPSGATAVVNALMSPEGRHATQFGKTFVLVDEDIDAYDADAVNWAITTRSLPHRDVNIVTGAAHNLADPSLQAVGQEREMADGAAVPRKSIMIVDATAKWRYTPVSLPKREYMERALQLWNEARLPTLEDLEEPWWGYSLGLWSDRDEEEARLATSGKYYETGQQAARLRIPV